MSMLAYSASVLAYLASGLVDPVLGAGGLANRLKNRLTGGLLPFLPIFVGGLGITSSSIKRLTEASNLTTSIDHD